ncbi:hypothetical protein [Wolbachia endosymbiont of Folsomia candida]|uniref:hypothetical protein n=1 Tax=Wolbachia endosymbiont of Folsomia candida TaxID=169402 RepID=UPI000AC6AF68|nr:hypothetical protein [Wolbachia endosymbiont of Folsomia candida]APR98755.1 hypothetical protein ASM33_05970 [Wolbachia endosymbiont of Folsomia candida]
MVNKTKCAEIKYCDVEGERVLYYSEACRGNEKFVFAHSKDIFPAQPGEEWKCPTNYVKVQYAPEGCSGDNRCFALEMNPVTDSNYFHEHC